MRLRRRVEARSSQRLDHRQSKNKIAVGYYLALFLLVWVAAMPNNLRLFEQNQQHTAQPSPPAIVQQQQRIHTDLLLANPESIWTQLIAEAAAASSSRPAGSGIVMEVGMHRATQCLQAATAGLAAYCVEPSPASFQRVRTSVQQQPSAVQERVHLYQAAAGATSGDQLEFAASGGTGDHVGQVDVWNMKTGPTEDEALKKKQGQVVMVPSIRLDDIVKESKQIHHETKEHVYLLKVDTQGFEPAVFAGLEDSLRNHNVDFILLEFWPKGMDLMAIDKELGDCIAGELLQRLWDHGYELYAMGLAVHPNSPSAGKNFIKSDSSRERPFHNVQEYCRWFYTLDERFAGDEYKMGYWSDIMAVAPGVSLPRVLLP